MPHWKTLCSSRSVRRRHATQSLWIAWKLLGLFTSRLRQRHWAMDGRKKERKNSNWKMIRPKLFVSHHHLLSTRPCHTHRQVSLSNTNVEFSGTVRNLGFIFDSDLSMKQHIIKTCKAAYIEIRCISSMCQYLTEDTTKALVNSCIQSRLDYCNYLLAGYPQTVIKPLQQVQNSAAKLILKSRKVEHAKRLLKQLHWLPIEQRIKYKVAFLAVKSSLTLPLSTWLSSGHFSSKTIDLAAMYFSVPCCCLHPS